jgi:carbamoyl-phosphate synthase large subunit
MLRNGTVSLLVISSSGDELDLADGRDLRRLAVTLKAPLVTTIAGAKATAEALAGMQKNKLEMKALQECVPPRLRIASALACLRRCLCARSYFPTPAKVPR